jgi:hypothetical protein
MTVSRSRTSTWSILLVSLLSPHGGSSQPSQGGVCHHSTVEDFAPGLAPKARAFLGELQTAVKAGDRQKLAALVRYPLDVYSAKEHRAVRTSAELIRDFDRLFTPSVRKAIEQQMPACLFANFQGVMIGDGEVWFEEQQNGTMKVKTLNP